IACMCGAEIVCAEGTHTQASEYRTTHDARHTRAYSSRCRAVGRSRPGQDRWSSGPGRPPAWRPPPASTSPAHTLYLFLFNHLIEPNKKKSHIEISGGGMERT